MDGRLNGPGAAARLLALLGLGSAILYLLAYTLPYWLPDHYLRPHYDLYAFAARQPWRSALFYGALAALFGLYLVALRLAARAGRDGVSPWAVGAWSALFCLLLIPVQPFTAWDLYGYVFQGRIVAVLGQNPYAHLYRDFGADPFYFIVAFRNLPATTGYGPLWVLVEAGVGWLARDQLLFNLLLLKGLAAGCYLAGGALVYGTLRHWAPAHATAGMLFFAWNPLLLHELVANGHNDAAVAALALLGFYALSRARIWWALPCLAAAALVKPVLALWLPVVAVWLVVQVAGWPARLRRGLALVALALVPAVLAYAPFWAGATTFRGLWAQSDIHGNSLPNAVIWALWSLAPGHRAAVVQGVKLATALLYLPLYGWLLWRARRDLLRPCYDAMLLYLLLAGFQFWPWYLAWLLVPAALLADPVWNLRRCVALGLCAAAPLLYLPFGWHWARRALPPWGIAVLAALPLLAAGLWLAAHVIRHRRCGPLA